jgi:hypothetical protein
MVSSKTCTKCGVEKPLEDFRKDSSKKSGRGASCKSCNRKRSLEYYYENKKERLLYSKKWYDKNKDHVKEYDRKRYEETRESQIEYSKNYYKQNREERLKYGAKWYNRKKERDPIFNLYTKVRALLHSGLKRQGYSKTSRTHEILQCSYEELMEHLNNNPYGFKYEDGGYDIDHIVPVSSAKTEEELLKLNVFTNLQLLPSEYNRHVKKDQPFDSEHFKEWLEETLVN